MHKTTMALMAALLAIACDQGPAEPTPDHSLRAAGDHAEVDDLVARPPDRGVVRGGERLQRKVVWPEASSRDADAYASLDVRSREAVDLAPVPVLVPGDALALDERKVMQGRHWAAFWGQREGLTVSLHASGMAHVLPHVRPMPGTHTVREREGFISRNEGIWSASWIEHGVAYSLELECSPPDAPACADDQTLVEIASDLVYVGGRGEEVAR